MGSSDMSRNQKRNLKPFFKPELKLKPNFFLLNRLPEEGTSEDGEEGNCALAASSKELESIRVIF